MGENTKKPKKLKGIFPARLQRFKASLRNVSPELCTGILWPFVLRHSFPSTVFYRFANPNFSLLDVGHCCFMLFPHLAANRTSSVPRLLREVSIWSSGRPSKGAVSFHLLAILLFTVCITGTPATIPCSSPEVPPGPPHTPAAASMLPSDIAPTDV